ncbi:MAG: hypothetical protein CL776_00535 [Chloroflexi bacterium]|nr:hypothetical protein [Chloroflexota bacterium]|tara:strand:+ start:1419 stop:2258 length:840 start_codon:yes stop_codon:yes gene_type:complete
MFHRTSYSNHITSSLLFFLIFLLFVFTLYGCTADSDSNLSTANITNDPSVPNAAYSRNVDSQVSTGLHVTGTGKVEIEPELARINAGVEVFSSSVSIATKEASKSAQRIIRSLISDGISEDDISTQNYDIQPTYEWRDSVTNGVRTNERILTGYVVNNDLVITVRNMDTVGSVIDNLTIAGGDSLRVDRISFSVESFVSSERDAMLLASQDAIDKANMLATKMGFKLGRLLHVSESSYSPRQSEISYDARAFAMAEAPTPINAGDLTVSANIYAIFEIK